MPEAVMTLRFDGDAVDAGAMDVRQLAPALIAAADLIEQAHFVLRIPGPSPQVELRATRSGSFIVVLAIGVAHLLTSTPVAASVNFGGLVSTVTSTFGLVKKLGHRKVASTQQIKPGLIRITTEDGVTVETPPESFELVLNAAYSRTMRHLMEPLAGDRGIRSMTISADGQSETMTASDLPSFGSALAVNDDIRSELARLRTARAGAVAAESSGGIAGSDAIHVGAGQVTAGQTEDPREALDNSYQRQLNVLAKARRDLVDVSTSRKHAELQINQLRQQLDELDELLAVDPERASEQVEHGQSKLNYLEQQYALMQAEEEKLAVALARFQARVDAFDTQKETLKAAYTAAEAQARIGEALAGISEEMRDAAMVLQRAEDKTMQVEARAGAIDELLASGALDRVTPTAQTNHIQAGPDETSRRRGNKNQATAAQNQDTPGSASRASTGQRGQPNKGMAQPG